MVKKTGQELEPINTQAIVMPAVSAKQALEAWKAYLDLKLNVLDQDKDFTEFTEWDSRKGVYVTTKRPNKAAWRKMSTFFNVDVKVVREWKEDMGDGRWVFYTDYIAVAPNGRMAPGDGACDTHEKHRKDGSVITNSMHNTRGTAHTRGHNRAVSNLVGGGEVSAEEITADAPGHPAGQTVTPMPSAQGAPPATGTTPPANGNGEKPISKAQLGLLRGKFKQYKVEDQDIIEAVNVAVPSLEKIKDPASGEMVPDLTKLTRPQWVALIRYFEPAFE